MCLVVLCRCLVGACFCVVCVVFFFKQKTAYEMRISDWSSDVCSSDLRYTEDLGLHVARVRECIGDAPLFYAAHSFSGVAALRQIGRASCRERVCQYV